LSLNGIFANLESICSELGRTHPVIHSCGITLSELYMEWTSDDQTVGFWKEQFVQNMTFISCEEDIASILQVKSELVAPLDPKIQRFYSNMKNSMLSGALDVGSRWRLTTFDYLHLLLQQMQMAELLGGL
jgi:hypothetical protein